MNTERLKEIREELYVLYKKRNNKEQMRSRLQINADKNHTQIQMINAELAMIQLEIRKLKAEQTLMQISESSCSNDNG